MEPNRKSTDEPRPAEQPPAPKKRFRIDKLEERIAPKKGGNTNGNGTGTGRSNGGGGSSISGSSLSGSGGIY
jgi:hypothetical protein